MSETRSGVRLLLIALLVAGLAGSSLLIVNVGPRPSIILALTLSVAFLVTLKPDWAVYLLIFSMLLSPEFAAGLTTKGGTLGRGVTFRFDDLLLALVGLSWLVRSAIYKELGVLTRTRLNGAIALYIVACSVSTLAAVMMGRVQPLSGSLFVLKYTQY